ncbi:putative dispersed gene family protein 1 (DGF-1) [Trypanosoma cruzi]|nr:putative dispersed gene family protein 1 (DGF-1) [Trypanosoma cruzi]
MFRDDDCLCSPLRWQEIDWTPCPGLLSALGGERMVCAVPHCGCGTPPATTRCGRTSNLSGRREVKDSAVALGAPRPSCCGRGCAVRMTLFCAATWMAVLLRALCGGLPFSMSLPCCVWEICRRGCVRGSERGWLPPSSRSLEISIQMVLLDGVLRHPGCGEEEDGEGLLWAEGG